MHRSRASTAASQSFIDYAHIPHMIPANAYTSTGLPASTLGQQRGITQAAILQSAIIQGASRAIIAFCCDISTIATRGPYLACSLRNASLWLPWLRPLPLSFASLTRWPEGPAGG